MTTIASPPANWAIALYVDGVLAGTNTLANHDSIDYAGGVNAPYRIGCYNNVAGNPSVFFKGKLDLAAERFATRRGGRSARGARQFVDSLLATPGTLN